MQSETITIADAGLHGRWNHNAAHKQLIILCHGYRSSHENPTIVAIANGLNQKGRDTFIFNFSENTGGFDIKHQVQDITQILDYFRAYNKVVLLGGSFGALTAAIATSQSPRITALITFNGFFGQGELGHEHRKTYVKFRIAALLIPKYAKIYRYYKKELQPNHINVPVLVIHSKTDTNVFIKQSRDFYEKLTVPKRFVTLEDANHGITSPADRQYVVEQINAWLPRT